MYATTRTIRGLLNISLDWDWWPDGYIDRTFTPEELKTLNRSVSSTQDSDLLVPVHWACRYSGLPSNRTGPSDADEWLKGSESRRTCLGVIVCENQECDIVIRPATRRETVDKQLAKLCPCGSALVRPTKCPTIQKMYRFKGRIHFVHKNFHNHDRPTYTLHLTHKEQALFTQVIEQHPRSGPLQLLVGVPTLRGPGPSVAEISPVLHNRDRVGYERQKIKAQHRDTNPQGSTLDVNRFNEFCHDNPDFMVSAQLAPVVVLSMQSKDLLAELVKATQIADEPVNGILTDAAHGYWKEDNNLLVVSSIYSQSLQRWIPGLVSYTNGATEQHYCQHFLTLFQTIAHERMRQGLDTSSDSHFCNVGC